MRRVARGWPVLLLLAAWVVLGPIGMAFDSCATMMVLCDGGPCGVVAAVTFAGPALAPLITLSTAGVAIRQFRPVVTVRALDPPPKRVVLSV